MKKAVQPNWLNRFFVDIFAVAKSIYLPNGKFDMCSLSFALDMDINPSRAAAHIEP